MKYKVEITEILQKIIEVDASSEEERNIMYKGLNLINECLNKLCDEYDSNNND